MKPRTYFLLLAFGGFSLALISLWLGCWAVDVWLKAWQGFPACMTAVMGFMGGGMLGIYGVIEASECSRDEREL